MPDGLDGKSHPAVPAHPALLVHLDPIAFDDRVRQHFVGNLGGQRPRLTGFAGGEIELEVLSLTDIFDRTVAERMQCIGNRPALRIEHRWLPGDEYSRSHLSTLNCQRSTLKIQLHNLSTLNSPPPRTFSPFNDWIER